MDNFFSPSLWSSPLGQLIYSQINKSVANPTRDIWLLSQSKVCYIIIIHSTLNPHQLPSVVSVSARPVPFIERETGAYEFRFLRVS